ncbi:condensation domain-containing protein [Phytohabitans kaempferiae]|uniref:Condensation domain-containing protein n=1 Tax=Phytohabitans kaempferiae TaxID=1620943 RepID=A0ABV6MAM3_9ACTN
MSLSVEDTVADIALADSVSPLEPDASVVLKLTGASTRVGPATWGQLHMLRHLARAGDNAQIFNYHTLLPVPDGCDLRQVLNAVRDVLDRFETLRTTCQPDGDGWRQTVHGDGELAFRLYEAPAERVQGVAERAAEDLSARPFAVGSEWPVRCAVVLTAGRPVVLVVAFSHLALDAGGGLVVQRELSRLLAGGAPQPPPAWQPVDQAEHEQSSAGRELNEQAMAFLRQVLRSAPASMFDFPLGEPVAERAVVLELRSPAAAAANALLADRLRVSTSSVFFAAVAVLLGAYSGRTTTVMHLVANNRTSEPQLSLAANLAMDGVCAVDFAGLSFRQVIRHAFEASIATYLNSQADPSLRWETIGQEGRRLGRYICLGAALNDGRPPASEVEEVGDEPLESLLRRTELIRHHHPFGGGRFYIHAGGTGAQTAFTFIGDALYVPHEAMSRLAYGLERLLVTAVARDIPAAEIPAIAGVQPVRRGPEWVRCPDGWADLAASRELWRTVAGTEAADIYPVAIDGSLHRLVGYLCAPADERSIADLHRDFMAALEKSTAIRTPDWYVRCAEAPVSRTDRGSWAGLPVVAEGHGR